MAFSSDSTVIALLSNVNDIATQRRVAMMQHAEVKQKMDHLVAETTTKQAELSAMLDKELNAKRSLLAAEEEYDLLSRQVGSGKTSCDTAAIDEPVLHRLAKEVQGSVTATQARWTQEAARFTEVAPLFAPDAEGTVLLESLTALDAERDALQTAEMALLADQAQQSAAAATAAANLLLRNTQTSPHHAPVAAGPGGSVAEEILRLRGAIEVEQRMAAMEAAERTEALQKLDQEVREAAEQVDSLIRWLADTAAASSQVRGHVERCKTALARSWCDSCNL